MVEPISDKMRCAVSGCTATEHSKRQKNDFFFPFPKDAILRTAWINACGRSDDFATDSAKICQLHFDQNDYERIIIPDENCTSKNYLQLKSHAIPTLNLPKLSKNGNQDDVSGNRADYSDTGGKGNVDEIGENTTIKRKKCAIIDCTSQSETIFDFPDYQQHRNLFLQWLFLCKNDALKNLEPDNLSESYGICRTHLNENGTVILHNQVPILNLPGKNLIPGHLETQTKEEAHEASQLCRLCFSIGSVNLFSKYNQKIVKNIVTMFVPIRIQGDDVSKLICEKCKCEVIRFYRFLVKSLQVDEFFQAINEEAKNKNRAEDPLDDASEVSPMEFGEDSGQNLKIEETAIIKEESSLLRQFLTIQLRTATIKSEPLQDEIVIKEEYTTRDNDVSSYIMKGMQNETSNNEIKCKDANKSMQSADTTIICIHCNKSIESIDTFKEHCRLENHDPIFTCPDCNRIFKTEIDLNVHSDSHGDQTSAVCEQCGKQFTKWKSLYTHVSCVHDKNGLKYDCKVCSKKFSTDARLKLHSRVHTNEKPYCCEQCGSAFTLLSTLKNHQETHSGYKRHMCLICKRGFNRKSRLAMHLTQHSATETNFSCDKCGITYKRHVNLKVHKRKYHSDTGEVTDAIIDTAPPKKNFECIICEKKFALRHHLQAHVSIHTGEKPHKCRYCPKRFARPASVTIHERIHSRETPYTCVSCDKSFGHLTNLKEHMLSHHGLTVPE